MRAWLIGLACGLDLGASKRHHHHRHPKDPQAPVVDPVFAPDPVHAAASAAVAAVKAAAHGAQPLAPARAPAKAPAPAAEPPLKLPHAAPEAKAAEPPAPAKAPAKVAHLHTHAERDAETRRAIYAEKAPQLKLPARGHGGRKHIKVQRAAATAQDAVYAAGKASHAGAARAAAQAAARAAAEAAEVAAERAEAAKEEAEAAAAAEAKREPILALPHHAEPRPRAMAQHLAHRGRARAEHAAQAEHAARASADAAPGPAVPMSFSFEHEDKPYEAVTSILHAFPLLRDQPVWNIVNPVGLKLASTDALSNTFGGLTSLLSPQGHELSTAFPKMRLRDLPVFEWLPPKVAADVWNEPIETSLPDRREFFPSLLAHRKLQDLRIGDLLLVAEQKRTLWNRQFKALARNMTLDQAQDQIVSLEGEAERLKAQRNAAQGELRNMNLEYDALSVSSKKLRRDFESDQALIAQQQATLAEEGKLVGELDVKLATLEATRKEQHVQLDNSRKVLLNLTHASYEAEADLRQKDGVVDAMRVEKEALERKVAVLEHQLKVGTHLSEQTAVALQGEHKKAAALSGELNATLVEESAEAATNRDLEKEVDALRAERDRLTAALQKD